MDSLMDCIKPADIGLVGFEDFRKEQREALEFAVSSEKRFVAMALPTGSGKSVVGVGLGKLMGLRTVQLTATKGLQEQNMKSFKQSGLVDIRGRSNYDCAEHGELDCRAGSSLGCKLTKGKGCTYERFKYMARNAGFVGTNYSYWMNVNDKANGLERSGQDAEFEGENPVELLVLDEAHAAPEQLAKYVSCRLVDKDLKLYGEHPANDNLDEWAQWARETMPDMQGEIASLQVMLAGLGSRVKKHELDHLHKLELMLSHLGKIAKAQGSEWVVEEQIGTRVGRVWNFDCVWPGKYAESYLFCGVPKVLLMSATLKPKTLWDLGIKKDAYDYRAWKRVFPANRCPVYMVGAKTDSGSTIRVDNKTSEDDMAKLVRWIDEQIIKPRLDRKGLIQTVSYARAKFIVEHSKYGENMLGNTADPDSETAQEVAEVFKQSKPPCLLVSPSFSTGWDFPGSQCEYIILVKVPFEPAVSKIVKARAKKDPQYLDYKCMQVVEQSCGRGMRFEMDRCEVFLVDGHFEWFIYKNKGLAQDWFVNEIRRVPRVPPPPERLKV